MRAALRQFEQRPILERLQIYSLAMIAIILIARLFDSYTLDETGMVYLLQKPFHDFYHSYTVKFPMLSLYEVMMWSWSRLAGSSEAILRFPSLIFFFGSAVLVFKICERHLISGTGLATVLIFFSMPQVQKFATTARPYALIIFLITAAIYHLFKWLDQKGIKNPNSNRSLYVSGIFLGLACLTKIFCFELVPAFLILAILGTNEKILKNISQNRILVLFLFLAPSLLTAMIQFKTALHFQTQSSLHQPPSPPLYSSFCSFNSGNSSRWKSWRFH